VSSGLLKHPEKTKLIEFGRFAAKNRRERGLGKPDTFDFLGNTHSCSVTRKGYFMLLWRTTSQRMRDKLVSLKGELRKRINHSLEDVAKWLKKVANGYYNYYAIHDNLDTLLSLQYHHGATLVQNKLPKRTDKENDMGRVQ
jgi:hypothetical protein